MLSVAGGGGGMSANPGNHGAPVSENDDGAEKQEIIKMDLIHMKQRNIEKNVEFQNKLDSLVLFQGKGTETPPPTDSGLVDR